MSTSKSSEPHVRDPQAYSRIRAGRWGLSTPVDFHQMRLPVALAVVGAYYPESRNTAKAVSPSADGRHGLFQRLSLPYIFRRLSRNPGPSSGGSPTVSVRPTPPAPESDILRTPPTLAVDDSNLAPVADSVSRSLVADLPEIGTASVDVVGTPTSDLDATDDVPATLNDNPGALTDVDDAPADDPMTEMWNEAVAEWQRKTDVDLTAPDSMLFSSKDAIVSYIAEMEEEEEESKQGRWRKLHDHLLPLARIFERLCAPIGETLSTTAFPPSKVIFSAVGMIIHVYIRTHEEHEQIVDAFDEIRNHLQIIEAVGANSRQCLHGANVKLLAQILNVLGVIVRLRRNNYGEERKNTSEMEYCFKHVLQVARDIQDNNTSNLAILRSMEHMFLCQVETLRGPFKMERNNAWLGFQDPSPRMSKLLNDRAASTGLWLFESEVFAAFKERRIQVLMLYGSAPPRFES
uniref:Fungal STAND N-terminal Goodbye domain-containing protein n=2 Tax=Schizophyllum commune (strain H4-8 / FGSC 9210) TaxID=578458 RepID=D8QAM6_SCHCM